MHYLLCLSFLFCFSVAVLSSLRTALVSLGSDYQKPKVPSRGLWEQSGGNNICSPSEINNLQSNGIFKNDPDWSGFFKNFFTYKNNTPKKATKNKILVINIVRHWWTNNLVQFHIQDFSWSGANTQNVIFLL